jgi:hypothetical protein
LFGEKLRMNDLISEMNERDDVETEAEVDTERTPQDDIEGIVPDTSP